MSTQARDTADLAEALARHIYHVAIQERLPDLAVQLADLWALIVRMGGSLAALEDQLSYWRRYDPFPGRTEDEAGPIVDLDRFMPGDGGGS